MSFILILAIALFIIFNYMPAIMELSALENERQAFLQLENRVKELEKKVIAENLVIKTKSATVKKQIQKQVSVQSKAGKVVTGKLVTGKPVKGNRGYVIREGKPFNPFQ